MAAVQISDVQVQGFAAKHVENGAIALTLIPDLGGKISSLRDMRSGREWLWTNQRMPYRPGSYGASYVQAADTGGWDECFPTVAACSYPSDPWRGRPMPDHGEIWPQPWALTVETDAAGAVTLHTIAQGVALPYLFERRVRIAPDAATVRLDYRVESRADAEMPFIWSAHPILAIEPGMRLLLPDDARLHTFASIPPNMLPADDVRWPAQVEANGHTLDYRALPGPDVGVAFKLWSAPLAEGWATLEANDGALYMVWNAALLPQVGLWLNAGAWAGDGGPPLYNMAIEPCIGAQDSLEEAVMGYGQYGVLPARGARSWWIEVSI